MSKLNKMTAAVKTVGLDVGDKKSQAYCLSESGDFVGKASIPTTPKGIAKWFGQSGKVRVAMEAGTHCHWISWALEELGHTVIIANSRKLELITKHERKSDDRDARMLAELGHSDRTISLLAPIRPKTKQEVADRSLLVARRELVRVRSALVISVRGIVKANGLRLPAKMGPATFHNLDLSTLPEPVAGAVGTMLPAIEQATKQIREMDRKAKALCKTRYPETTLFEQVKGVGPITALFYRLTICDPKRFQNSRDVGAFVGLVPRRNQSGDRDPQLRITKTGDRELRSLLVQCAHYILGHHGRDCDLRRFGERIQARGGRYAKKRAVIAVARKLAVLLHRLWITGEVYDPLRNTKASAAA